MKKSEYAVLALVAIVLGTGMHFVHHAPFFNEYWGLVFPVRESVWEHMKMLLYPLLLESVYLMLRQRDWRAFSAPMLLAIPAMAVQILLFFAYWIFVGHEISIIDVLAYIAVMGTTVVLAARWADKPLVKRLWPLAFVLMIALVASIACLTYHCPPNIVFQAM